MNFLRKALSNVVGHVTPIEQNTNPYHPRVERRRTGISARQQRRRIKIKRRHALNFNREIF